MKKYQIKAHVLKVEINISEAKNPRTCLPLFPQQIARCFPIVSKQLTVTNFVSTPFHQFCFSSFFFFSQHKKVFHYCEQNEKEIQQKHVIIIITCCCFWWENNGSLISQDFHRSFMDLFVVISSTASIENPFSHYEYKQFSLLFTNKQRKGFW